MPNFNLREFPTKALVLLSKKKNDIAFTTLVKKIIKGRYSEENISLLNLTKMVEGLKYIEKDIISELIIEKSLIKDEMYLKKGMDIAINNVDIEHLWIAARDSKINYVKEVSYDKLFYIIDEIEKEMDLQKEKIKKMGGR